jgi:ribulose-5-phosphate 4-epimerase/fuculose-1-phosphate aldolase
MPVKTIRNRTLLMCRGGLIALAILVFSSQVADRLVLAQTGTGADQAAIDELVLMNRMLASSEMGVLGAYGHVSVRNRRDPSHYFISRFVSPGLVTASDIYESDLEGKPVSSARPDLIEDRFIHGEIYKARPDVMAVVYSAAPELAAFSVSSKPLVWNNDPMKVFDFRRLGGGQNGLINTPALGKALADSLGRGNAVLVFGQGAVVVSATTNDLVSAAVRLEQDALQQQFATALGGTPNHVAFTRKATPETRTNLRTGIVERVDRFSIFFNYLGARDLGRIEPDTKAAPAANSDQAVIDELVVANRLLASTELGVLTPDGLAHVSARSRTNPNHFFIAHDVAPGMVTPADIIEDDLDAKPVKAGNVAQYSERFIHSEIYRARPDIMAVLHAHTPELRVFGQSSVRLRPVWNRALFIGDGLPVFDIMKFDPDVTSTLINSPELGRALVGLMGKKDGALLLDHGIALADSSLRGLVSRAYNLRQDARIQRMAIELGGTVNSFEAIGTAPNGSGRGTATYSEWDYWKQIVVGSADLTTVPKPASGLPLRPHQ